MSDSSRRHVTPFTPGDLREFLFDDGSRLFAELWETKTTAELCEHAITLESLSVIESHDEIAKSKNALLSFDYEGHRFFVSSSQGEYLFFVKDSIVFDSLLMKVARHFNELLRAGTLITRATIESKPVNEGEKHS